MELLYKDTYTHTTHFIFPFPQLTKQCSCRVSESVTFGDLPVAGESSTQRDGNRWQVSHMVAVAVHAAVSSRADCLRGQTGAVRARV